MLKYYLSLLLLKESITKDTSLLVIQLQLKEKFNVDANAIDIELGLLGIEEDLIEEHENVTYPDDFFENY